MDYAQVVVNANPRTIEKAVQLLLLCGFFIFKVFLPAIL